MSKLTPKQKRFVLELMKDENAKQAAIRAGYSPKSAEVNGPRLCRYPVVMEAIAKARQELAERMKLQADEVIEELKCVIFNDPRTAFGEDGQPLPVHRMPEKTARALAGVEFGVADEPGRVLNDGHEVKARARAYVKKLRFNDKVQGLGLAMKHLGLLTDKMQRVGKDGRPLEDDGKVEVYINTVAPVAGGTGHAE